MILAPLVQGKVQESETKHVNTFRANLEGDSMEPKSSAGEIITVVPNSEPRNGDSVLARLKDDGVMSKWFRRRGPEGKTIILESLNPDYGPIERPAADVQWIYPAIQRTERLR